MFKIVFTFIFLSFSLFSYSQFHDYGFEKTSDIVVKDSTGVSLQMPWVGGLSSCQFGQIDLDFDGVKDLVVFERVGNRLMTFINNGTSGVVDYGYNYEYEKFFPTVHDWLFLVDYNGDGKEDIFTYYVGGMSVYRNDSDPVNGIQFTKMTNMLNSLQYGSLLNLYVSEVELPGIGDVNGDGCPDILVFHILGSYLNLHTNQSMVKYGHCDSLDFVRTHHCWGNFYESETSNELTLNITCPYTKESSDEKSILHVGSTILPVDLTGNGLKDVLIGDTDFPLIIAAYNSGTNQEAQMTSQNISFPANDVPVNIFTMPLPSLLDLTNDGKADLIFSPADANPLLTQSHNSVWFYKNTSNNNVPDFKLQTQSLFQEDMIETGTGAYPVLFDIDNDGMMDLFVSNFGFHDSSYYQGGFLYSDFISKISFFKNTGTVSEAEFKLITDDFGGLSDLQTLALYPAFGDIDGDGDYDMLVGEDDGSLRYYENIAGTGNSPVFAQAISNYQGIDVGRFSTPQIIDLNRNGILDLVIGNRTGRLSYYENTGTASNPTFVLVTDSLGGVNVRDYNMSNWGYSVPCFFKDTLGEFGLFVGSESGKIHYYKSIDNNLNGTFDLIEEHLLYIYDGIKTGLSVHDLNNDGYKDMILGNFSGGLTYYKGKEPEPIGIESNINLSDSITIYPNPANNFIRIESYFHFNQDDFIIEIFNITGQLVLKMKFRQEINTESLQNGIYILKITDIKRNSQILSNKKLVINRW
ncbi:MAG: T9SS type A sorting domain-containing protein [Bacteroidales bacterium]|nr:T9SS type A sorting domain-containing protein [Bacteroidales bacterium]